MKVARNEAIKKVDINLCTTQYQEDSKLIPNYFTKLSNLKQSVLDHSNFEKELKLPLIKDIILKAYHETTSDYIIYTNVDIGLQKNFYLKVDEYIRNGFQSIIINRKRIPGHYKTIEKLDEIYKEKGKKHPGFDCFVFHRNLVPQFCFNNICIGVPFIGITFAQNLFALDRKCLLIENEKLTFHIGMEIFAKRAPTAYFRYNQKEFWKSMKELSPKLNIDQLPYSNFVLPIKLFLWGLHPSIPIRLVFQLLLKKYKNKI